MENLRAAQKIEVMAFIGVPSNRYLSGLTAFSSERIRRSGERRRPSQ
jgi:hypothetical protein